MTPRRKRQVLFAAAIIAAAVVAVVVKAPYLPGFFVEGFPGPEWPASGTFALVPGGGPSTMVASAAGPETLPFDPRGRSLFEDSGGKALLVFEGGRLRFEHYAEGFGAETRFNSYSMVKSLVGALVLKARSEDRIASLDDPIGSYLGDLGDAGFQKVPIADFLRMRSGVVFEPDGVKGAFGNADKDVEAVWFNPFGPLASLHMQGLKAVAGRLSSTDQDRGRFSYQNVNTAVLGALLETVYDRPLEQLLGEKIWVPAMAAPAQWRRYGSGRRVSPYCCLYATARDWVRIGRFIMNNGTGDEPFLLQPLWRRLMGSDLSPDDIRKGHYGPHIRHDVLDRPGASIRGRFAYMVGNGGQTVYMMPGRDLVVVRFGTGIQLLHSTLYSSWRTIAPAVGAESAGTK